MASITTSGIGSGLDIANLVQQLVAAEGRPLEFRIARQEARVQAKLSAFGSLKSSLSGFNDQLQKMNALNTLLARKGSSADEDLLTVVVGETALPASYSVEILQLAQAQKLESAAFADPRRHRCRDRTRRRVLLRGRRARHAISALPNLLRRQRIDGAGKEIEHTDRRESHPATTRSPAWGRGRHRRRCSMAAFEEWRPCHPICGTNCHRVPACRFLAPARAGRN